MMSSSNLVRLAFKKEVTYGVTPASVKATVVIDDITYTAVNGGSQGNSITIQYADTVTAGSETVVVTGNAILVNIEDGVSTATQVSAAIGASAAALALVTRAITGTASDPQVTTAATNLASGSGEWSTARFVSESYSGTPETTESQQIRTDRMSSGQVVTGLTVGGKHDIELAKETAVEDFMESAMFNNWSSLGLITRAATINATAKTITSASGSYITDGLVVGDFVRLGGYTNPENNVTVMLTDVTALVLTYVGPEGMVNGTGGTTTLQRGDKLSIGITKKSFSIEKSFLDLTTKAINYKGMLASGMELKVEYGSLISGAFTMSGNDYTTADAASEFLTYQSYIDDPATTQSLNGSVDMPFLATDVTGSFESGTFCIQSLNLNLSNNLTTQTCIGKAAPENYNPGTAKIEVSLSSYLKDSNWDMLARKLSQDSFGLGFEVENTDGWYGFYLPAIQVSFDDPASGGANQDISMDMTGQAKVGANGESALTIYRSV
jgi:hypothetical protein